MFDTGSIFSPTALNVSEKTLLSLPGVCSQHSLPVFADGVPTHCLRNTFYHQWIQAGPGLADTEDAFPSAEKVQAFLADTSVPVVAATMAAPAAAVASAKEESEESEKDVGLVSSPGSFRQGVGWGSGVGGSGEVPIRIEENDSRLLQFQGRMDDPWPPTSDLMGHLSTENGCSNGCWTWA